MHNIIVHSNESACRKIGRLGLEQVIQLSVTRPQFFCTLYTSFTGNKRPNEHSQHGPNIKM